MSNEKRFTFQNDDVAIATQRVFTRFASKQTYEALAYASKAHENLAQALRWFARLDDAENLLLEQGILLDEPKTLAQQDQAIRQNILRALSQLHDQVGIVRRAKIQAAAEMERMLEQATRDAQKNLKPAKPASEPAQSPASAAVTSSQETTSRPGPTGTTPTAEPRHKFAGIPTSVGGKARFLASERQIRTPQTPARAN